MAIQSIPLKIISTGSNTFVAEVQLEVDGESKFFLLDTGAVASTIISDDQTKNYKSIKQVESKGAAGIAVLADIIQMQNISLGHHTFAKSQIKRADRNILGLDLLNEQIFEVDLKNKTLNFLNEFLANSSHPIRKLQTGHVTISMSIKTSKVDALFDTGADTAVIDAEYIKQNPQLFEFVRTEDGYDAHGNKIPSIIYKVSQVEVGHLKLQNIEMAAFNFGHHLRENMEGAPIILGNNVIAHAKWIFDLKSAQWSLIPNV